MAFTYEYPRPMVTTDVALFTRHPAPYILLIRRKNPPFKDCWALPGGFLEMEEDLHQGARRELLEETGIEVEQLRQFKTYGKPGRDPRGRTLTVVFTAQVEQCLPVFAADDAAEAGWFRLNTLPPLAFDHGEIIDEMAESYSSN